MNRDQEDAARKIQFTSARSTDAGALDLHFPPDNSTLARILPHDCSLNSPRGQKSHFKRFSQYIRQRIKTIATRAAQRCEFPQNPPAGPTRFLSR